MNLSSLQTFIGNKVNDPTNQRYTLSMINQELDNAQDHWNLEAGIVRDVYSLTLTAGTYLYNLSLLTGTPINFLRATLKGLDLQKRSKNYFDLYSSTDWTLDTGTPLDWFIDMNTPTPQIGMHPTPQAADVTSPLKLEYVKAHTSMVNSTDTPFMNGAVANSLLTPYHEGLGLEVAAALLAQDPSDTNMAKIGLYTNGDEKRGIRGSHDYLSEVIELYGHLDYEEPWRMQGGRYWQY